MASLRTLPSGGVQASVLLDSGKRTTKVLPDHAQATAWAIAVEQERDELRASRRDLVSEAHTALIVDEVIRLCGEARLSADQVKAVRAALSENVLNSVAALITDDEG